MKLPAKLALLLTSITLLFAPAAMAATATTGAAGTSPNAPTKTPAKAPAKKDTAATKAPQTAPVVAAPGDNKADPVLIKGVSMEIRASEFELEKKNIPADQRLDLFTDINRIQRTLERLTLTKLLMTELQKSGYDKRPEVQQELNYVMSQKLAQMYVAHLNNEVKLPDFEPLMRERYLIEKDKYKQPERVRVAHILITTKSRSKEDARKRAEEVRTKALAGIDFNALAREYSEDPSVRRNGGDLGFVSKDSVVPAFGKAAFALKNKGDISEIVETEYGLHVIRYEERKPEEIPAYEELRKTFFEDAARDYRANAMRNYFADLMDKERPMANMDEVNKLLVSPQSEELKNVNEKIQKEIRDANPRGARKTP